jgi:NAD(P)-dependent dehydrogenase (short-subunit alcohol dehydrogenase family)
MARGTVVITGTSTGIGFATAERLRDEGFEVFAGIRGHADAERLREHGVKPLVIDVSDAESIATAAKEVGQKVGSAGLSGLVNNAGIAVSGPLEFMPIDKLREQLEVNLIGQVAAIQAFLPLLRSAHGRIVNVSSIGGRVALPMVGPYNASKFALEAVSDTLRRELHGQGIGVSVIEPGGVKTPIWAKGTSTANEIEAAIPEEGRRLYGNLAEAMRKQSMKIATETGIEPSEVAESIAHALTAKRPRTRYLVGRDARIRWMIAKRIPDRWFDALVARTLR